MSLEAPRKTEQIPHSGKSGLEAPVREFDKTPLEQAVQEGLIKTPDHVTGLTETKEKKSRKKLFVGIGATAAVALGAAGAIFGVNAAANQETPPKEEPVATAPANPSESEAPAPVETNSNEEQEPQVELGPELLFDQDAQTLGTNLMEGVVESWVMAGTTEDLSDNRYEANLSYEDYLPLLAEENAKAYAEKYFVDPAEYPEAQASIDMLRKTNETTLGYYSYSAFNSENEAITEPYETNIEVDGDVREISNDGTTRVLEIDAIETSNAERSGVDPIAYPNVTYTATLTNVDGEADIISLVVRAR